MTVYETEGMQLPNSVGSEGYLQVHVGAAQRALPIFDAIVSIYATNAEVDSDLLAILQTDESGDTETITLPAPLLINSQEPGGLPPYNVYYARIVAPNYITQDYVPIQIFPGVVSVLIINMLPPPDNM